MRHAAADVSGVGFDRPEFQAAPLENIVVGAEEVIVGGLRTRFVGMEGIIELLKGKGYAVEQM